MRLGLLVEVALWLAIQITEARNVGVEGEDDFTDGAVALLAEKELVTSCSSPSEN